MNSKGCSTLQFSIGCLTETHEGNWIQQDVKYLLKLTGPIRLRSNIHFSTIWIGCHCHQCVWQTTVDITYTHSILYQCGQSWKLMPRRGWVKFFPPSSYEITNDSWLYKWLMTFWQQLHNNGQHQAVLYHYNLRFTGCDMWWLWTIPDQVHWQKIYMMGPK